MQDQKKGQSTGSTGSKTGGSVGAKGRTGEQMQNTSDLPDTETGPWTGAPPEAVTHGRGERQSEETGMRQTSAMIREEQGRTGGKSQGQQQQYRGQQGYQGRQGLMQSDLPDTEIGRLPSGEGREGGTRPVTRGRGEQESEDLGMDQASRMIREQREEGDPEMQMREEDLHARQQNLGERERSLRERDEQLRMREQGLRERQSKVTGKGMGSTDYQDYRVRNDR